MNRIIEYVDKQKVPKEYSAYDFSFVATEKNLFQGIALTSDVLFTSIRKIYSFRCRVENVINSGLRDVRFYNVPQEQLDRFFLEEYFKENLDNPFAVYFILTQIINGIRVNKESIITQFPPLLQKASKDDCLNKFENLKKKIKPGDQIFMFDRTSNVSRQIRRVDRSQWSHVAMMYTESIVQDMTTSGLQRYDISNLDPHRYDLAVYRAKEFEGRIDFTEWYSKCDDALNENPPYNWSGVGKAWLYRSFPRLRFIKSKVGPKDTTLSDLLSFNMLRLIDYV